MRKHKAPLFITLCAAIFVACSSQAQKTQHSDHDSTVMSTQGTKTLVVFFSHRGENYSVGNISVGNTKHVADAISSLTGADEFEIEPVKNYDMPYNDLVNLATEEGENNEYPEYKGKAENMERYDTIYVGGPIWRGTYPRVMFTFFRDNDLSGKTLIPFTTHEGSGMGRAGDDLKKAYPKANVLKGFSIYGHECQKSDIKNKVARLIKK